MQVMIGGRLERFHYRVREKPLPAPGLHQAAEKGRTERETIPSAAKAEQIFTYLRHGSKPCLSKIQVFPQPVHVPGILRGDTKIAQHVWMNP